LARFRPGLARLDCDADFVALRVEPFEGFVAVLPFGADLDFLTVALAGARPFAGDVFAFVRRLVGGLLEPRLRAPITAPDTAPIKVPTTGVPTAVPTTAPATAPPRVLLAALFSSLDRISFLSSSVMFDLQGHDGKARRRCNSSEPHDVLWLAMLGQMLSISASLQLYSIPCRLVRGGACHLAD
jgi:hypothetical protein